MPTATITSKGQITIPIEVRNKLGLKAGDQINFFVDEDDKCIFEPKTGSIMDMKGILKHRGEPLLGHAATIKEMDEALLEAVSQDYLRSVGEMPDTQIHKKAS